MNDFGKRFCQQRSRGRLIVASLLLKLRYLAMKRKASAPKAKTTKKPKLHNQVTYYTLLRGINVSGQKCMRMAELREALATSLPSLQNLRTYIQTGNIIYETEKSETRGSQYWNEKIEKALNTIFDFSVSAITRNREELEAISKNNPYTEAEKKRVFIIFLNKTPEPEKREKLADDYGAPDEYQVEDSHIYVNWTGHTKSKLTNNNFERLLGVTATARNLNTVQKLLAM